MVQGEPIALVGRVYLELTESQIRSLQGDEELVVRCLLARHYDGYVRQEQVAHLAAKIDRVMVVPFLMALVGEYVVEIHRTVSETLLPAIDRSHAGADAFESVLRSNPDWWQRLGARVISYWAEYYRREYPLELPGRLIPDNYPAAQTLRFLAQRFDLPELTGPLRSR